MASWSEFECAAPEIAAAGRRRLAGADGVSIGFLAWVYATGQPRIAPVCPVFTGDGLHLIAATGSPKCGDLRERPRYALHAFLGDNDEEFQIQGRAREVPGDEERADVHAAVPFAAFSRDDPIFRLGVERALWVHWERVGQPDTQAVRTRWSA